MEPFLLYEHMVTFIWTGQQVCSLTHVHFFVCVICMFSALYLGTHSGGNVNRRMYNWYMFHFGHIQFCLFVVELAYLCNRETSWVRLHPLGRAKQTERASLTVVSYPGPQLMWEPKNRAWHTLSIHAPKITRIIIFKYSSSTADAILLIQQYAPSMHIWTAVWSDACFLHVHQTKSETYYI